VIRNNKSQVIGKLTGPNSNYIELDILKIAIHKDIMVRARLNWD
jgi:hypothetical protein